MEPTLTLSEARRIALAAQGFDRPRPRRPTVRDVAAAMRRIGVLQIDFVNVLAPAHYLILFSRLGSGFSPEQLAKVYATRQFTEQWAHEAAIVPMDVWPLLAHRRAEHRSRPYIADEFLAKHPGYVDAILEKIRSEGRLTAGDAPEAPPDTEQFVGAWFRSIARVTLESLFGRGVLAVAHREKNFARCFDLAERVIPDEILHRATPRDEAHRELLLLAARAHGVGTAADLADYYRLKPKHIQPRIHELVEAGALERVRVEGWKEVAYRDPESRLPRRIEAASILSPFDPLVWFRPRGSRLFHFDYRIEIYTPAHQRQWGYYVLPFLLGERIVARVDLKADRSASQLLVMAAHVEDHAEPAEIAPSLATELREVARWCGLESVKVARKGALAKALSAEVSRAIVS